VGASEFSKKSTNRKDEARGADSGLGSADKVKKYFSQGGLETNQRVN